MAELFCEKCKTVSLCAPSPCNKCGGEMEPFDPCKHGRSLISPANSWAQISEKWDDHPIFEAVSQELYNHGCCGAASHINAFIRTLVKMVENTSPEEQQKFAEAIINPSPPNEKLGLTEKLHSVFPPVEMLRSWEDRHFDEGENYDVMLIEAFQAGADKVLEECYDWLRDNLPMSKTEVDRVISGLQKLHRKADSSNTV